MGIPYLLLEPKSDSWTVSSVYQLTCGAVSCTYDCQIQRWSESTVSTGGKDTTPCSQPRFLVVGCTHSYQKRPFACNIKDLVRLVTGIAPNLFHKRTSGIRIFPIDRESQDMLSGLYSTLIDEAERPINPGGGGLLVRVEVNCSKA